jgi:hypothetical protein
LISRYQEGLTVFGGVAVHLVVSAFWATVIEAADSRGRARVAGAVACDGDPAGIGRKRREGKQRAVGKAGRSDLGNRWPLEERKLKVLRGAVAGLMIAALDLEIIGRRYPAVRALPRVPQWLDHVAFGILVTALAGSGGSASTPSVP